MDSYKKIYVASDRYLYPYQIRFFKAVLNSSMRELALKGKTRLDGNYFRKILEEFCLYNFISEYLEENPDCGHLAWDENFEEVVFELDEECGIMDTLDDKGFSVIP
jgi:hypothetical protein